MIGWGVILALLTGVFRALKDIAMKKGATNIDSFVTSWAYRLLTGIFILPVLLIIRPVFSFSGGIFYLSIVNVIMYVVLTVLIVKSFEVEDVSLVAPMYATGPVFITGGSVLILEETFPNGAILGILLVVVGSYILSIDESTSSFLVPLKNIFNSPAAKYIFPALILLGIIIPIDKIGIEHSSPLTWAVIVHLGMSVPLFVLMGWRNRDSGEEVKTYWKILVSLGLFNALLWIAQVIAYTMTKVAYVQTIKYVSILLVVIYGGKFLNENNTKIRLFGTMFILVGISLIIFG